MLFVRSSLFALGYVVSILAFSPLSVMTFVLPFEQRYAFISQWSRFNLWWLKLTCNLRYVVEGQENIPKQNAIVLCKHQSAWETLALQHIFPPQVWILKRELLWIPFFGWGLAMLEPIAIERKNARKAIKQLLEQGAERLTKGRWVVVFPEGTRIPPGQRGQYHLGGARLAHKTAYPVVPVAHNAGEYWPRKSFIKHPGVIRLCIGPVIESKDRSANEINALAEQWIESKMREISGVPLIDSSPPSLQKG